MTAACSSEIGQNNAGAVPNRRHRIIQVHPTLACNLTCLHCYSRSAPHYRTELNFDDLTAFLADARSYDYDVLSLSGGEPFMYRRLEDLLRFSQAEGYTNALVTNGMLLGSTRNQQLLALADLVAVSVDGPPDLHNYVRNAPNAFEKMSEGVHIIREHVARTGIIHSVSRRSWESLLWLGEWAYDRGANLLQLHLLEETGRAETDMAGESVDDLIRHKVYVLATYLNQKYESEMALQLDMVTRQSLLMAAGEEGEGLLNSFLTEIVIDEQGNIVPFSYGFPAHFIIGNIAERLPLRILFERFVEQRGDELLSLVGRVTQELRSADDVDFVNWGEYLIKAAHQSANLILV